MSATRRNRHHTSGLCSCIAVNWTLWVSTPVFWLSYCHHLSIPIKRQRQVNITKVKNLSLMMLKYIYLGTKVKGISTWVLVFCGRSPSVYFLVTSLSTASHTCSTQATGHTCAVPRLITHSLSVIASKKSPNTSYLSCFWFNIKLHVFSVFKVTGESYPELLLNSLYSMLESCAHENILIKQTAVTGLTVISSAFQYRYTNKSARL